MDTVREVKFEEVADHWRWRCLQYCKNGGLHSLYYILRATGRSARDQHFPDNPDPIFPRFGNACRINKDGIVTAKYQAEPQAPITVVSIGTAIQVRDAMRRMADNLKLHDDERLELFKCFTDWIEKDERARSEN